MKGIISTPFPSRPLYFLEIRAIFLDHNLPLKSTYDDGLHEDNLINDELTRGVDNLLIISETMYKD